MMMSCSNWLGFLLMAAMLWTAQPACDVGPCEKTVAKDAATEVLCRHAKDVLQCYDTVVVSNSSCSDLEVEKAKEILSKMKQHFPECSLDDAALLSSTLLLSLGMTAFAYLLTTFQ